MKKIDQVIMEKARKLNQLEKEFLKFTYEIKKPENLEEFEYFFDQSLQKSYEAFAIRNEIQSEFHNITNIKVYDPIVRRVLEKIRANEGFESVAFYERLAEKLNIKIESVSEKLEENLEDYLFSQSDQLLLDFTGVFDYFDYYRAKIKIGPLISSVHVPENIQGYFDEIRDTYALGLYKSCVALCRALLEIALFYRLDKEKDFRNADPKATSINTVKEDNLFRFIDLAKQFKVLHKEKVDLAHRVRISANKVLHLRKVSPKLDNQVSKQDSFKIIINTIRVIEQLYNY